MTVGRLATTMALTLFASVAAAQDPGISTELERTSRTTAAEKLTYADSATAEITDAVATLSTALANAREGEDVEAVQCISLRLNDAEPMRQVADDANTVLRNAIANGELDRANHEFRKIALALAQTRRLAGEALLCSADQSTDQPPVIVTGFNDGLIHIEPPDGNDIDDIDLGFNLDFDIPQPSPF